MWQRCDKATMKLTKKWKILQLPTQFKRFQLYFLTSKEDAWMAPARGKGEEETQSWEIHSTL